ncbi:MAG: GNAT family N-acetyltransferase [Cytophagales bacterium]|nr:GNAT family N-acetyltransferase [Cytophagales bacterium]
MRLVFQVSYAVEAELLETTDFPPLKRTISEFVDTSTEFYGCQKEGQIVAIVEILKSEDATHIQSLVVHPKHFRQGLGQQLVQYALDNFDSILFTVETGLANEPAIRLYEHFGFKQIFQWDTDHGIRKVKLEKVKN